MRDEELQQIDFSTILASSVHDMKNSLGLLLNTLDEVMGECGPRDCATYPKFSRLQYEAKRVNNDLIQLLTLYRIDNSRYTLNVAHCSVADFIEESVLQNKPMFDLNRVSIGVDCAGDLYWFFDRDLMSGVVNNVLNNAFRYTRDKLRIAAREEDGYLVLEIEDNGQGYPEEMLDFCGRPKENINFATGSTGLGLYFATLVARMHENRERQGSVCVGNGGTYGGGCFSICLP